MLKVVDKRFQPTRAMKVFLIGSVPPGYGGEVQGGGVSTHIWELANQLTASGAQVTLMARNSKSSFTYEKIKVIAFRDVVKWRVFSTKYWDQLIGFPLRLVHFHHLNPLVILFRMIYKSKVKIVGTMHSFNQFKEGYRTSAQRIHAILIRIEARLADQIIFPAEYILEEAPLYLGKIKTPMLVIHNPIDISGFHMIDRKKAKESLKLDLSRKTLLFVGTLNVHKGVPILLEAFEKISRDAPGNYELLIIGDGNLKKTVLEYAGRGDLHVRYEGSQKRDDLAVYYNAADLFVMPSRGEGWGFVYGESLLCGTPVIACDISGVKSVLGGRYGVHFVPVDEPEALAKEIKTTLSRSYDREKLRKSVLNLNWENRILEFIELYDKVLEDTSDEIKKTRK